MKNKNKDIKKKKTGYRMYLGMAIVVVCVVLCSYNMYAKYYASRYNKGVTVASNLYFGSDKLKRAIGHTDINELLSDRDEIDKLSIITNEGSWSSGTLRMSFEIQNFDNSILYNDSNLDIDYKVKFVLLDAQQGAKYYAVAPDNTKKELDTVNKPVEFEGTIKGGTLAADTYGIDVEMVSSADYKESRVLVMAYPVSPKYIYRPESENQEYRLLGIFQGHTTQAEISIESARFKVQDDTGYDSTTWKNMVSDLSGYIYNVKTVGDALVDNSTASGQQLRITWDKRYVQIDVSDENYLYALEHDADLLPDSPDRYYKEEDDYASLIIRILPYSSIDITFYKSADFNAALTLQPADDSGREWFENLVIAEMTR